MTLKVWKCYAGNKRELLYQTPVLDKPLDAEFMAIRGDDCWLAVTLE